MEHPANFKNLIGERFGKLVVIEMAGKRKSGEIKWLCQCDCGGETFSLTSNLRRGISKSCGCERHANVAVPTEEYELRKSKELSELTDKWEYVRCYDRNKGKHIVRCVHCGAEKKVPGFGNISECTNCLRLEEKRHEEQSKSKACVVCGCMFMPKRSTALYCSEGCSDKAYNARHRDSVREKRKIRKRLRESKASANGKVDYSITITKLIERDNCTCMLCGRLVDESDYVYVGDAFVAGNDYPSIDHIKPLSKGGVHQWNNVQLAHRLCNSLKNNKEI